METYRVSLARPPHPESLLFVLDERLTVDAGVCPLPRPLPYIALVGPSVPSTADDGAPVGHAPVVLFLSAHVCVSNTYVTGGVLTNKRGPCGQTTSRHAS